MIRSARPGPTQRFWLWLCRFAHNRLQRSGGRVPDGVPTIRDIDHPCGYFTPGDPQANDWQLCAGDSHYLCKECVHYDVEINHELAGDIL